MKVYVLRTEQWESFEISESEIAGVYVSEKLAVEAGRKIVNELLGTGYTTVEFGRETHHSRYNMHITVVVDELEVHGL